MLEAVLPIECQKDWENLELTISRIPIPRMKYRKRLDQLFEE